MKWRPIKTAPIWKRVLVWVPGDKLNPAEIVISHQIERNRWCGALVPTHWMPLPEPPK